MWSEKPGNEIRVKYFYLQVSLALSGEERKISNLKPRGAAHHLLLNVTKSQNS